MTIMLRYAVLLALSFSHAVIAFTSPISAASSTVKSGTSSSVLFALSDEELITLTKKYLDKPSPA
eukprot:CAMPEP_0119016484 /NCGR_PEP_ID=MMETSP1176-20130426/13238_1 /TAXON_ID=265551 /ORGANISM="Synedropsis recta cf, Strain CCMP1620" /LENGTH=64 /DNA_ID=CAMNT_0006969919 /DNA_START=57 /DNA_END=248 /DNA_ORIENTATION=+